MFVLIHVWNLEFSVLSDDPAERRDFMAVILLDAVCLCVCECVCEFGVTLIGGWLVDAKKLNAKISFSSAGNTHFYTTR